MDRAIANPCKILAQDGTERSTLTLTDALNYIKQVKDTFQNQEEIYDMYLEILKDFSDGRVDTFGVMRRVKSLFEGHNSLINGFNKFLPSGYSMSEHENSSRKPIELGHAIEYVNKIKRRFEDRKIYDSFLNILIMYQRQEKNIDVVYKEVSELFKDHPDLLDEFLDFMPSYFHAATSAVTEEVSCVDKFDEVESASKL